MKASSSAEVTGLLLAWRQGDDAALEQLMPVVYAELRRRAQHYMAGERAGHTLQATALVNEVYLKLVDSRRVHWQNRAHFLGACRELAPSKQESTTYEPSPVCKLLILSCRLLIPDRLLAVSAQLMRRVLVDFARSKQSQKRGERGQRITLDDEIAVAPEPGRDMVALDDALKALEQVDSRKSKVVELRFFGGLTAEETAQVLAVSADTVLRDWKLAKVWLLRELNRQDSDED